MNNDDKKLVLRKRFGCLFNFFVTVGIFVGVPNFYSAIIAFTQSSERKIVEQELQSVLSMQRLYYKENFVYAPDILTLGYEIVTDVDIIFFIEPDCFDAMGKMKGLNQSIWIDCTGKMKTGLR